MRPSRRVPLVSSLVLVALAATSLHALAQPAAPRSPSAERFLERHGPDWIVVPEPITGAPAFVYGRRLAPPFAATSASEFEIAARAVVDDEADLFGFGSNELVLGQVRELALSGYGSSDKVAVIFRQEVGGMPVWNANVTVLFDRASGDVLALDTTGVPFASRVDVIPARSEADLVATARDAYRDRFALEPSHVVDVRYAIVGPAAFDAGHPIVERGPTLTAIIDLATPGRSIEDGLPAEARVFVPAAGDPAPFAVHPTAHRAAPGGGGVQGRVRGQVNLGPEPNNAVNQEIPDLANLWVQANGPGGPVLAVTDDQGRFAVAAGAAATLFVALRGPFFVVNSFAAPNSFFNVPLGPNGHLLLTFNPIPAEYPTAEVAAAKWIDAFRKFIKANDANDPTMDFQVVANVNQFGICDAFFNGNSINFFIANPPGCPVNLAYRSGFHHEEGHWAIARYNGNPSFSFHEGTADAWTYYINDDPCFWLDAGGPGTGCVRNGEQLVVKKCPIDGDESCHGGEVHEEGKALASALWKVKRNLKNALGAGAGGRVADRLFLAWMQTFHDPKILNVILDHWIVLDDDNGDLSDGTPHFASINAAFLEQGWPGSNIYPKYGAGCPGGNGFVPILSGTGPGKSLSTVSLFVTKGRPFQTGIFYSSLAPANIPLGGGCSLLVQPPLVIEGFFIMDAQGRVHLSLPTGIFPVATNVYVQAFLQEPGRRVTSNGLIVTIGP